MQMQTWGCSKENWHGNEKRWLPIEIEISFSKGDLPLFSGYMFVLGGVISVNFDDVSNTLRLITYLTQKIHWYLMVDHSSFRLPRRIAWFAGDALFGDIQESKFQGVG